MTFASTGSGPFCLCDKDKIQRKFDRVKGTKIVSLNRLEFIIELEKKGIKHFF